MGQKLDERLSMMTDEELYAVDPQKLNERSRHNLAREIEKRERRKADSDHEAKNRGAWIRWAIGLIVITAVTIAVAAYW